MKDSVTQFINQLPKKRYIQTFVGFKLDYKINFCIYFKIKYIYL